MLSSGTLPSRADGTVRAPIACSLDAVSALRRARGLRTARRLRCRSSPGRRRPGDGAASAASPIWTPRSAAFGRSSCTDSSGLPTMSDDVNVHDAGHLPEPSRRAASRSLEHLESGPLIKNCTSAFCEPPPPMTATGWTEVRRPRDNWRQDLAAHDAHYLELIAPRWSSG